MGLFSGLFSKKKRPTNNGRKVATDARSKFRGVQLIINRDQCCEAVRGLDGQRFLSHEVPMLPLQDCDYEDCGCTYKLYEDRRTDPRRASDVMADVRSELFRLRNRRTAESGRRGGD